VQCQAIPDIQNSKVGIINDNEVAENNISNEVIKPNDATDDDKNECPPGELINGNGDINELEKQQIFDMNASKQNTVEVKNPSVKSKSLKRLDNVRIEKHKVHVMDHNLIVSGVSVCERKERTIITVEDINGNQIADGSHKNVHCSYKKYWGKKICYERNSRYKWQSDGFKSYYRNG